MITRCAHIKDAQALAELDRRCFGQEAWSQELIESSLSLLTTASIVLQECDKIVGFALAQVLSGEVEILTLGVDPDFRRCGHGEFMVRHILCLQEGAAVFLEVAADNLSAQRLYERCGFTLFGRRPGYYRRGGRAIDALTYKCLVNEEAG